MAFVRGCRDASVRGLPAWEGEAVLILYAFLGKGVGVLFLFHQCHEFPSGTRWGSCMGGRSGGSVPFGNLLTDACKVISFVTTSAGLAWSWAYVTVVLQLAATEKAISVRKVPGLDLPGNFLTNLCAVVEVGEWTCSSVVELAKSLFVCCAASNDITWLTTNAGVKGGSSGFRWPSL